MKGEVVTPLQMVEKSGYQKGKAVAWASFSSNEKNHSVELTSKADLKARVKPRDMRQPWVFIIQLRGSE